MTAPAPLSQRSILLFWAPLAATWLMMAVEGPFLAAVIARLPEAKINLAAYGVAFAIAMLVESPVVMLMTTSTALAEDAIREGRDATAAEVERPFAEHAAGDVPFLRDRLAGKLYGTARNAAPDQGERSP